MRDISDYQSVYLKESFEEYKVEYRRKQTLSCLDKYKPMNVLEIGCASDPLFQYTKNINFTIVEPGEQFIAIAREKAETLGVSVQIVHGLLEESIDELKEKYNVIVCDSLLHEIEDVPHFLSKMKQLCSEETVVHITVPNANSMHRLLGVCMGTIDSVYSQTQNNKDFQQNTVFDLKKLQDILESNGFTIIEKGDFFIKPFSHKQMYSMLKSGIITDDIIKALNDLSDYMPGFGSEIYVDCMVKAE